MTPTLPGMGVHDTLASLTPADAERFRLTVRPDDSGLGFTPFEGGWLTCVSIPAAYGGHLGHTPTGGDDPLDLTGALERIMAGIPAPRGHYADPDRAADAAIRWARIFHGYTVTRWRGQGYSQSAWADGLVYADRDTDAGNLAAAVTELDAWFRGDVYGVALERTPDGGETWEPIDDCDVWGNILTADYTAADVARDSFGVPEAFAAAVPVVELDR